MGAVGADAPTPPPPPTDLRDSLWRAGRDLVGGWLRGGDLSRDRAAGREGRRAWEEQAAAAVAAQPLRRRPLRL